MALAGLGDAFEARLKLAREGDILKGSVLARLEGFSVCSLVSQSSEVMKEVETLQPTFAPAREVQSAIDYTVGEQTSRQTPSGTVLPERPQGGIDGERLKAYVIEIGKALFGRWGTVAGMVVEDVFETSP